MGFGGGGGAPFEPGGGGGGGLLPDGGGGGGGLLPDGGGGGGGLLPEGGGGGGDAFLADGGGGGGAFLAAGGGGGGAFLAADGGGGEGLLVEDGGGGAGTAGANSGLSSPAKLGISPMPLLSAVGGVVCCTVLPKAAKNFDFLSIIWIVDDLFFFSIPATPLSLLYSAEGWFSSATMSCSSSTVKYSSMFSSTLPGGSSFVSKATVSV